MTVEEIFQEAKARFVYTTDRQAWGQEEYWANIQEIEVAAKHRGGYILDDCDGFATFCVARLRQSNLPGRYVFCKTETGEFHCVAETNGVILDNRQNAPMPITFFAYEWISISGFHAEEPWHSISGLK